MHSALLSIDSYPLLFPAVLFVFYLLCWLAVGRDPGIKNVVPQYEPPPGVSPGVARYIVSGGSDGTTLASVLAGMAAKGVISIQPMQKSYQLELLDSKIAVWPEEAAIATLLFHTQLPAQAYADTKTAIVGSLAPVPQGRGGFASAVAEMGLLAASAAPARTQALVDPAAAAEIKIYIDVLQDTFRKNLQGVYFRQNFRFAGIGMLATFAWALTVAASIKTQSSMFITFWLLMFTSIAGIAIGGFLTSKPTQPTFSQRISRYVSPFSSSPARAR